MSEKDAEKALGELNEREPHMAAFRFVGATPACGVPAVLQQLPTDVYPKVIVS